MRRSRLHVRPALHMLLVSSAFVIAYGGSLVAAQSKEYLSVDDARPLAEAIQMLEQRYGWVVTYEDPRFEHEADVQDVTAVVSGPARSNKRVLVPKGVPFTFIYDLPPDGQAPDAAQLINTLLTTYSGTGNPGGFGLVTTGDVLHVVPQAIRNSKGEVIQQKSVLDVPISLTFTNGTADQAIGLLLRSLSQTIRIPVLYGSGPVNLLAQTRLDLASSSKPARTVLSTILRASGKPLSWQLFFDPGLRLYVFNVHVAHPGVASGGRFAGTEVPAYVRMLPAHSYVGPTSVRAKLGT